MFPSVVIDNACNHLTMFWGIKMDSTCYFRTKFLPNNYPCFDKNLSVLSVPHQQSRDFLNKTTAYFLHWFVFGNNSLTIGVNFQHWGSHSPYLLRDTLLSIKERLMTLMDETIWRPHPLFPFPTRRVINVLYLACILIWTIQPLFCSLSINLSNSESKPRQEKIFFSRYWF